MQTMLQLLQNNGGAVHDPKDIPLPPDTDNWAFSPDEMAELKKQAELTQAIYDTMGINTVSQLKEALMKEPSAVTLTTPPDKPTGANTMAGPNAVTLTTAPDKPTAVKTEAANTEVGKSAPSK